MSAMEAPSNGHDKLAELQNENLTVEPPQNPSENDALSGAHTSSTENGMELQTDQLATMDMNGESMGPYSHRTPEAAKYWELVDKNRQDFDSWCTLIGVVEREDSVDAVKEVYNEFLIYYPYCYGYWKKYADYIVAKAGEDEARKIYEEAVLAVWLSVDLWISYIDFCISKEDNAGHIRNLFMRAIEACGLEFKSDQLWDKYIDWETKNGCLQTITQLYRRLLSIPTKCYSTHYDNLKQHIEKNELSDILTPDELKDTRAKAEQALANETMDDRPILPGDDNSTDQSANGEMSEAVRRATKVILYDEFHVIYSRNEKEIAKRWNFEEGIRRPYFHSKALDAAQLKNWRDYLEFEVSEGDDLRIVTLFERCMIACAQYEEFWLKYAAYLEGMDRQAEVRNLYTRACRQHLPYKASMHITWAFYEERQGNFDDALAIMESIEQHTPDNMCVMNHKLNLLRRHGDDLEDIYKQYISNDKLSVESVQLLTSKYVRYIHKLKGETERAIDTLKAAIAKHESHEMFYTQLLDIEYQRQPLNEERILAVFDLANSSTLSDEAKQTFYSRRYEFLDDLGSDVNRLYSLYQKPEYATAPSDDRKRHLSSEDSAEVTEDGAKKAKTEVTSSAATSYTQDSSYSNYNYSQAGYSSGQYYNGASSGDWSQYYSQQQYPGYQQQGYTYPGYNYGSYGY